MIRILLADDQALLCEILQSWLAVEDDFEIVGRANNGKSALEQVESLQPDIVLIDIEMPVMDGLTATQLISRSFSDVKTIILSGYDDSSYPIKALEVGAKAYLPKTVSAEELAKTIRSVYQGNNLISLSLLQNVGQEIKILENKIDARIEEVKAEIIQTIIEQFKNQELRDIETKSSDLETRIEALDKKLLLTKGKLSSELYEIAEAQKKGSQSLSNLKALKTDLEEALRRLNTIGITPNKLKILDNFREEFNAYKAYIHQMNKKSDRVGKGLWLTVLIALVALTTSVSAIVLLNQYSRSPQGNSNAISLPSQIRTE
jgi:DNA-binding NarL/FixJ family response regulator